jgi:hypothetical protein
MRKKRKSFTKLPMAYKFVCPGCKPCCIVLYDSVGDDKSHHETGPRESCTSLKSRDFLTFELPGVGILIWRFQNQDII